MSSRRSSRDPNASSFNLFTGEETSGAAPSTQRTASQKTASSFNLFTGEEISGSNAAYQQQQQMQQHQMQLQQRAPSSNVWASNQSQNCGNMLSERPSTLVSQAPGGRSSFTIGDPDMVDDRFSAHSHRSTLQSRENYPAYQEPSYNDHQQYAVPVKSGRSESSNSWARNDSQNSGNYITDRPSTRVVNPPGGRNAMGTSFGW